MQISTLSSELENMLSKYMQSEVYQRNNYPKDVVSSILIALNLWRIASRNSNRIRKEDHFWFEGQEQVAKLFDEIEWENIAALYNDFTAMVKQEYF